MQELTIGALRTPGVGGQDAAAVLADLVNEVYAAAEEGMWPDGFTRTTPGEVAELAGTERLFVAYLNNRIVGCVRVEQLDDQVGEFGMLAADPAVRGIGIGSALVQHAENFAASLGNHTMQLEVIQPRGFSLPSKEFLTGWYSRMGYEAVRTDVPEVAHPELALLFAVPCDVVVYRKKLRSDQ